MEKRNSTIDTLRGISIIGMIIVHTGAYFLTNRFVSSIWNFSEFVVPVFVFCSSYLFFKKYTHGVIQYISYFKKRVFRLLIPYYIFLLFFIPTMLFFNPKLITGAYILNSFLTIGGVDISWLVLLFLCLTLVLLFMNYIRKYKLLFEIYFIVSLLYSCVIMMYSFPIPYKYIMWFPWSFVLYFTVYYLQIESKKRYWV